MLGIVTACIPPDISGIGMYSYELANALHQIKREKIFIFLFNQESPTLKDDRIRFHIVHIDINNTKNILNELFRHKITNLVIQYSQYEIHNTALPYALLRAIKAWRSQLYNTVLQVIMHEMELPSIARRKEILLYPFQLYIIKKILQLSDKVIVNNDVVQSKVIKCYRFSSIKKFPVFSGFGEISLNDDEVDKKDRSQWIIFGSSPRILSSLYCFIRHIDFVSIHYPCKSLIVFGGEDSNKIRQLLKELMGKVGSISYFPEVSKERGQEILKKASFSYMNWRDMMNMNSSKIFNSTVFASCLAFGVVPFVSSISQTPILNDNKVPLVLHRENLKENTGISLGEIILKNYNWYIQNMSIECVVQELLNINLDD
jgi:hypothetical protein